MNAGGTSPCPQPLRSLLRLPQLPRNQPRWPPPLPSFQPPPPPTSKALEKSIVAAYRDQALRVALNPSHRLHLLPLVPKNARRVLDVGCHAGHILEALRLPDECQAFGCDTNVEALELAKTCLPNATFKYGAAEDLPFADSSFDFLFARGVVVNLDIPKALSEFSRVLSLEGKLWLSLHRLHDCRVIWRDNSKNHPVKTVAFAVYTILNSGVFHYTGKFFRYPLNRQRAMTFQTEARMRKELEKAGFGAIVFSRGAYLVVEAQKQKRAGITKAGADS